MKNRQGITMMILVVTIILILILVGTLTVSIGNSIGNSRIATFASDLQEVEEMTKTYYMLNKKFPSLDDKVYTQSEILAIVPARYNGKFMEELQANGDDVIKDADSAFYLIDLAKIDIEQMTRGTRIDDDGNIFESNVFAVSYPSMNVYYLYGLRANDDVFFSLSSKITQLTKIKRVETVESGSTSLTTANGIIVKKETDEWTNKLNITIESNMAERENLYIQLGTGQRHLIPTVLGNNIFQIQDNLLTIYSNTTNSELDVGIMQEEIENFNNISAEDKKIIITKDKGGNIVGKAVVNLANYDIDKPGFTSYVNVNYQPTYNHISFNVKDSTSGVSQVKYEYLTKINEKGESVPYYNSVDNYDDNYMKTRGKKATISKSGLVEIKVPKDIEVVQINVFDKAGNSSAKTNQRLISDIYLGINPTELTTSSVKADLIAKVANGKTINSCTVQLSVDGISFNNSKNVTFTNLSSSIYKSNVIYTGLSNLPKKVYIKATLNYGNNEETVIIKEVDINLVYSEITNLSAHTIVNNASTYYGKTVSNYTTGNTQIDNSVDWQVFYSDGSNIYLIATDYVKNTLLPKTKGTNYALSTNGEYKAYWNDNVLSAYNGSADITDTRIKALNKSYHDYLTTNNTTSTNPNMKAVAYMLDIDIWNTFAGSNADYAIGGPTVEMLMKSYSQKYGVDYRAKVTSVNGYHMSKDGGNTWSTSCRELNTNDTLYVINASDRKADRMWLASPSALSSGDVMRVNYLGEATYGGYGGDTLAFRPIVCLNSSVTLKTTTDGFMIE